MKVFAAVLFVSIFSNTFISPACAIDSDVVSQEHYYILVKKFLNLDAINSKKDGGLKNWREWDSFTSGILNKKHLSLDEVKIYMFVVMIADARTSVATSEHLSETILNRFSDNREIFFEALKDSPFFILFIANQIAKALHDRYHNTRLNAFLNENEERILEGLGRRYGNDFIELVKAPKATLFYP